VAVETNLGFFGPFMQAWGRADDRTHAELYIDALAYLGGSETPQEFEGQVSQLLGIPVPLTP